MSSIICYTVDFFLWFIFSSPFVATIAIDYCFEQKDDRDKVNRRIRRLEEYDMQRGHDRARRENTLLAS